MPGIFPAAAKAESKLGTLTARINPCPSLTQIAPDESVPFNLWPFPLLYIVPIPVPLPGAGLEALSGVRAPVLLSCE